MNFWIIRGRTEVFVAMCDGGKHPGGKHMELGVALAAGVKCVLLGRPENGMQYATGIDHMVEYDQLLALLDQYHVKGG